VTWRLRVATTSDIGFAVGALDGFEGTLYIGEGAVFARKCGRRAFKLHWRDQRSAIKNEASRLQSAGKPPIIKRLLSDLIIQPTTELRLLPYNR